MAEGNVLPAKVPALLRRLHAEYETDHPLLAEIIQSSRITVIENTGHNDWGDGIDLHTVKLFLPIALLGKVKIRQQPTLADRIRDDLNACAAGYYNESFNSVVLEIEDENDSAFQAALPYAAQLVVAPESLSIWRPGSIRLFITHRDGDKAEAHELATALEQYGVSAFVAHDTIEPMTTWKDEILNGLTTMEVMLALVTDTFEQSFWTQQEIGFALGRGVPIIPLKVGHKDPPGFISSIQALKGRLEDLPASASDVYKVLAEKLGNRDRLQGALINAFITATNYDDARDRFDRMSAVVTTLKQDELIEIKAGFFSNNQLHGSFYLTNHNERLSKFLAKTTGQRITISGNVISTPDDKIPF